MKNVQFVPNQLQDLISVFQVATHVKEMFILSGTIWFIWYESYDKVGCIVPMVIWPEFRMGQYRDASHLAIEFWILKQIRDWLLRGGLKSKDIWLKVDGLKVDIFNPWYFKNSNAIDNQSDILNI